MRTRGLEAGQLLRANRPPTSIAAFIKLHIKQGPVLDQGSVRVGVVEAITLFKWNVTLIGRADHAGTTPMACARTPCRA
jgi:N-carbamoyl-L-amino-acid hydrolase